LRAAAAGSAPHNAPVGSNMEADKPPTVLRKLRRSMVE